MNKSKRNLTKVLGAVGTGALVWKKPLVSSTVLPAHASTSPEILDCVCAGNFFVGQLVQSLVTENGVTAGDVGVVNAGSAGGIPPDSSAVIQVIFDSPTDGWGCEQLGSICGNGCSESVNAYWLACDQITAVLL